MNGVGTSGAFFFESYAEGAPDGVEVVFDGVAEGGLGF